MDSVTGAPEGLSAEAVEFVRFCYRRRRAGWPELYDEMCAVASRGAYLGWSHAELADHGIRFSLFELPTLAALVRRVAAEEAERRRVSMHGTSPDGAALERIDRRGEQAKPAVALAGSRLAVG